MDLGAVVGFDPATSDPQSKWYGSGFQRSVAGGGDEQVGGGGVDDWKKGMLSFSTTSSSSSPSLYPSKAQKTCNNSLPYFHLTTAPPASSSSPRNSSAAGQYYPSSSGASLSFNGGTMMMMHGGSGGVFTPSQWMELEHQALIYKYLTSNVPVPLNLLIPIRKALESAAFSSSSGFLRPNALGWVGPFHLGFSSNSDPEPGRCRRTDGKKWRCSRDAVPDQKYCERHINRGRHRSRKPVEVRSAQHSVASTTNNITAAKAIPAAAAAATTITAAAAALAASRGYGGGSSSNVPAQSHHHHNNADLLASIPLGRMFVDQINGGLKSNESSSFMISKQQQQHNLYAESSSRTEFGLVSSESLLNPSQKPPPSSSPTLMSCRSFSPHDQQQHSLRQFMDDWPKIHQPDRRLGGGCSSNSSSHSWQETADRTQLSISIATAHNAAADFMSSSSSPEGNNNDDKVNVSPLRPSGELDSVHRQANWDPISWENSMGGPLGEVLQSTNNNGGNGRGGDQCKVSNSLSLMTEGWDSGASSPTGVLQRTTFVSLSNSSAGSSPRAAREQH